MQNRGHVYVALLAGQDERGPAVRGSSPGLDQTAALEQKSLAVDETVILLTLSLHHH